MPRDRIEKGIYDFPMVVPDHLGLAYDVYAPTDRGVEAGKVPTKNQVKTKWLEKLEGVSRPEGYDVAFRRWRESLKGPSHALVEVRLAQRLLIGHGNAAPTEVGFTVHRTWGTPVIPGSALKGLLAQYVDAALGPRSLDTHPRDPSLSPARRARARWRGVRWDGGRIADGPGDFYQEVFGAPAASSDLLWNEHGAGESRGGVVFHDALWIPDEPTIPVARDTLTVHQREYYNRRGARNTERKHSEGHPNDHDSPVPVAFLSVKAGTRFLLALSGADEGWTRLTMALLLEALTTWGVGGKTTSGYGRIVPVAYEIPPDEALAEAEVEAVAPAPRAPPSPRPMPVGNDVATFQAFLDARKGAKNLGWEVKNKWASRLATLPEDQRGQAIAAIEAALVGPHDGAVREEAIRIIRG